MHHSQSNRLKEFDKDVFKVINIARSTSQEVEEFIDELTSCESIFSSSLHGVIVAQAYGIPAQWITVKNSPIHSEQNFKFEDYFLGASQEIQRPICIELNANDLNDLKSVTPAKINEKQLTETASRLLESFPPLDLIAK